MVIHEKNEYPSISLIEAVDILSFITEHDNTFSNNVLNSQDTNLQNGDIANTVHWNVQKFNNLEDVEKVKVVKEIFYVIFKCLNNYYEKKYTHVTRFEILEQIKNIMVLVGETAKKFSKLTEVFEKAQMRDIYHWNEYKQLQEFYIKRIARQIDQSTLGEWMLGLTQCALNALVLQDNQLEIVEKHIFVDLEAIKKDEDYELFFMRKQDASKFYSPHLLRNMMLASDFGDKLHANRQLYDPLSDIISWQEEAYFVVSKVILNFILPQVEIYIKELMMYKDKEMVAEVNKCLVALFLCIDCSHSATEDVNKSAKEYFADFQFYLHCALRHNDYRKWMTNDSSHLSPMQELLKDILQTICFALHTHLGLYQTLFEFIEQLIEKGKESDEISSNLFWDTLRIENKALTKQFKNSPKRYIAKVLEIVERGTPIIFDSLHQNALPSLCYEISFGNQKVSVLHLPSPTSQEFIHKVFVNDEFKAFLRYCISKKQKCLLINLQDRASWREGSRSKALEELTRTEEFENILNVVTLDKDSDFYHQKETNTQQNHADLFLQNVYNQITDSNSGFFFKKEIAENLFPQFMNSLIQGIHRMFFLEKNILLIENRKNFIEIVYLFLQLKLIDIGKPDFFSLTCKDGVDVSASANTQLYIFIKLIKGESYRRQERILINPMLYGPAIFVRERLLQAERFNRFINAIKCIELLKEEMGAPKFSDIIKETFGALFAIPITELVINIF